MTGTITSTDTTLRSIRKFTQADNPSAFLAVNEGNSHFTTRGHDGVITYRKAGDYLVQFGGPFAATEDYLPLLGEFRQLAIEERSTIVAVQLQRHDAEIYAANGFTVNQVGASYAVRLADFDLAGSRFMRLRNKIARARQAGLEVFEADEAAWHDRLRELDEVWLRSKGEHTRELEFLVGQYGGPMQEHRRLFVGVIGGELVGYITYSPVYGSRPGWMHDLSRRIPGRLPGIMEAINRTAIDTYSAESVEWLHFGFTPFTGLADELEFPGHSIGFTQLMHLMWEYGEAVYPARTQLAYKQKWAPDLVLPEYLAFDGPADVGAFAHVFRAAGAF